MCRDRVRDEPLNQACTCHGLSVRSRRLGAYSIVKSGFGFTLLEIMFQIAVVVFVYVFQCESEFDSIIEYALRVGSQR